MDRNTIIGLVLIAGIVLTWTFFFSPDGEEKPQPKPQAQTEMTSGGSAAADTVATGIGTLPMGMDSATFNALSDSAKAAAFATEKSREHGVFAALYEGKDRVIEVETDKYKIALHTKGGRIGGLHLKDFKTADSLILPIQTDDDINGLSVNFMQSANVKYPNVSTSDLYFEPSGTTAKLVVTGDSKDSISLKAKVDETHYIEYIYTFKGNAYDYALQIRQSGMESIAQKKQMSVNWQAGKRPRSTTVSRAASRTLDPPPRPMHLSPQRTMWIGSLSTASFSRIPCSRKRMAATCKTQSFSMQTLSARILRMKTRGMWSSS
jgi:YidC/Oxa1 family membrane protein insertase